MGSRLLDFCGVERQCKEGLGQPYGKAKGLGPGLGHAFSWTLDWRRLFEVLDSVQFR